MGSDKSIKKGPRSLCREELSLPSLTEGLVASFKKGHTFSVKGTNVVRVPFGIRQPQKQRPHQPERMATLVLPLQPLGSPTPPPQAA